MSTSDAFRVDTQCWLPDSKKAWVAARITSRRDDGPSVTLSLTEDESGEVHEIQTTQEAIDKKDETLPQLRNPSILETSEDLTSLSYLNEPSVLHTIRVRYDQLQIYTYSGIVLIATNPFQNMPSLYSHDIVQTYAGKRRGEQDPHLFAIAEDAYRCMLRDSKNQTIIVSGESGAGKTVSAKYIMRYFATVEDPTKAKLASDRHEMSETEKQILATNPIMEAFGNAKTTRNDNSSRFGKYIEIQFDRKSTICGARIRTYLLERSRLVFQPKTERNYHIFYQLCAGATQDEASAFGLKPATEFLYMNQGGADAAVIDGVDDALEFKATRTALATVGLDDKVQHEIFKILAALLHMGDVQIRATRSDALLASDEPSLVRACELLGLDAATFAKWCVKRQIVTRGEKIVSSLSQKHATVVRDSVAKYIYTSLFDWLVIQINQSLQAGGDQAASFIGVLDIYGFEHFDTNSFEQFCINYANEKLQQEFNQHVFKLEQEEYVREGLNWTFIEFSDNQECIDLIEARLGVLSLLDEESRLPAGSDESWATKLHQNFEKPKYERVFKKPRFGKSAFTIKHYALDVTYEAEGFIEKNRDTVPEEHLQLLNSSTNEFLKSIIQESANASTRASEAAPVKKQVVAASNRKPTLGSIFKGSLVNLMDTINSTNVHYIRCIKPNETKRAWHFEPNMVLSQLRACGVLETIRISCAGFPSRWTFEEFLDRYYMLSPSDKWTLKPKEFINYLLAEHVKDTNEYQIGHTKLFLRAGMLAYFERLRSDRLNEMAIRLQKNIMGYHYRRKFLATRHATIRVQSCARARLARIRLHLEQQTFAATKIQSVWRGSRARSNYLRVRKATIRMQSLARAAIQRRHLIENRQGNAIRIIQRSWRRHQARKEFVHQRRCIVIAQSLWRRKLARRELEKCRIEARSASHFKQVSYKLENKVVELTQALERRTQENKTTTQQLTDLRAAHDTLKSRGTEDAGRVAELELKLREITGKFESATREAEKLTTEMGQLRKSLEEKDLELSQLAEARKQDASKTKTLETRIQDLQHDIDALTKGLGGSDNAAMAAAGAGIAGAGLGAGISNHTKSSAGKRGRRKSSGIFGGPERQQSSSSHHQSQQISPESLLRLRQANTRNDKGLDVNSRTDQEVVAILENHTVLANEIARNIVEAFKIPQPSLQNPPDVAEVLFPGRVISLTLEQMWDHGMFDVSKTLLARVMTSIQTQVGRYEQDEAIIPGAFWLSNVHEVLSFVNVYALGLDGMDPEDVAILGEVLHMARADLESLEFNIYLSWMIEMKKKVQKIIVPAVIESQSLPGFITTEGSRFLSKLLPNSSPSYSMDDLLNLFNKIYKAATSFALEPNMWHQALTEILKLIGVTAFNDLITRRNFLSWKRGLQINYNLTRIEEWCKSHDLPEGTLQLEHLLQATKLLQLKKATLQDIEIIYDICWMLSAAQVQKLINQYYVADYEHPISQEILKVVASRVIAEDDSSNLLLESVPLDDCGSFEVADPRSVSIPAQDIHIPSGLQAGQVRRLVDMTASATDGITMAF